MASPVQRRKATPATSESTAPVQPEVPQSLNIDDILGGNFGGAQVATAGTKTATTNVRVRAAAEEMADQVVGMESMSPDERIAVRKRILEASVESLRNALPEDRQSLGALVKNLNSQFADIGEEFSKVTDFNAGEQRLIDVATQEHTDAVARVTAAKVALQTIEAKWNPMGLRNGSIAKARTDIVEAEAAEKIAFAAIDTASKTATDIRSERLQTADFEASFKTIMACVEKTKTVLIERIGGLEVKAADALRQKLESYVRKEAATKNMETLQGKVDELGAQYASAREECDSLEVGSSARATKEKEVSALQRQYEETKAQHDQQLVIFQSMEMATKTLEIGEASLRAGLHAHKVTLAKLVADSSSWVVEFQTRVAQIRAMASQQASSDLIALGSVVRRENAKRSAEFAIGSLANITEQAERHPGEIEDIGTIASAMAEGLEGVAARWKKIEAKTKGTEGSQ